jgi:uncharacterized RDD family membrane protein YckC
MAQPYAAVPTVIPYANWGERVGAYLIDWLSQVILVILAFVLIKVPILTAIFLLGAFGWSVYNRWYLAGTTGQSLGKKTLHLKLVSEQTGQPIGVLMAFVRDICHIVDTAICYVGYLFPLWDTKRQTIADKIVGTVVIPDGTGP